MTRPEILPLGPDGVLVRFADALSEPANRAALAFRAMVDASALEGVSETATSLTSTLVRFRPDQVRRTVIEEALFRIAESREWSDVPLPEGRTLWHIPALFEGPEAPDLEAVSREIGRDPETAISELTAAPLRVLALGFAPGQPYLGFLPEHWNIPRRTEITPEVPRGAVVVAVRQVIPFANPAPTGWWQVGRTAFRCHDPELDPAIPLKPGDELRFQAVSREEFSRLSGAMHGGAEPEAIG